jgi:signal transduction histidine kinase
VCRLASTLGTSHALLARLDASGTRAEILADSPEGSLVGALALAGTPHERALQAGVAVVPRDLARLFPDDLVLAEVGLDSYAGIVVRDGTGAPCAVLAALGTRPLVPDAGLEAALRLFAARATSVLAADAVAGGGDSAQRRAGDRSLRARGEILAAVAHAGERLLRAERWADAMPDVLEMVGRAARAAACALLEARPGPAGGTELYERCRWPVPPPAATHAVQLADDEAEALRRGDPLVVPSAAAGEGAGMDLLLPVRTRAELWGALRVAPAAHDRDEVEALRAAAGVVGAALERWGVVRDLRMRERILGAVATSAEDLLASSWRCAMPSVLAALGEAIGASRAYLAVTRVESPSRIISSITDEWVAAGVTPTDFEAWADWVELPEHVDALLAGATTRQLLSTTSGPLGEAMQQEGTLSEMNVPLLYEGTLFGYIGFDDCRTERIWTDAEEEALLVAAGLIGGAMAVEDTSQKLASRERILEAVAAAGAILLDVGSWRAGVDRVLAGLGAAAGADRARLFQADDPQRPETMTLTHVWARDGDTSELASPAWQEYEVQQGALERLRAGRSVAGTADEMPEPARSAMRASGTTSFTSVPVHVHGRLWGLLVFDDCGGGRTWTATENEALRAAAGMLGAAVERAIIDETLRASEARLRQAEKMEAVGRLASGVAHDFNNILTGVGGYAALLADHDDDRTRRYAGEIAKAVEHANQLVSRLLTIGRPAPAPPELVDVSELVASLEGVLRGRAGAGIELTLSLDPTAPRVLVDGAQLRQVVVNLVANAVDAIDEKGAITLVVETGPDGSSTRLVVEDTGAGIDDATLADAFEPFVTTKSRPGNAGLGLSIVYGIVAAAGGFVTLESEPGHGTRAIVTLPAAGT